MNVREQLGIQVVREGSVRQVSVRNKFGFTWVPGVRAAKVRYGRLWLKVLLGQQSLKLVWGRSPAQVDETGDN